MFKKAKVEQKELSSKAISRQQARETINELAKKDATQMDMLILDMKNVSEISAVFLDEVLRWYLKIQKPGGKPSLIFRHIDSQTKYLLGQLSTLYNIKLFCQDRESFPSYPIQRQPVEGLAEKLKKEPADD